MSAPTSAGGPRLVQPRRTGTFHVLVPVGLPEAGPALLALARSLVPESRTAAIHPLHVAAGPWAASAEALQPLLDAGHPGLKPLIRDDATAADGIAAAADETAAELIVLGWQRPKLDRRLIGGTVASVMERTAAEVVVLYDRQPRPWRRLLVPYLFGDHDMAAVGVAHRLAREAESVTILHVVEPDEDPRTIGPLRQTMGVPRSEVKVVPAPDPLDALIREAKNGGYDAIVVGTSRSWGMGPTFLGVRHELLARETDASMVIVRAASV